MYLPCFYIKYVRFSLDLIISFIVATVFSGSVIIGGIIALGITFLNYSFRFYSHDEILKLSLKDFLVMLLKMLLVHVLMYSFFIVRAGGAAELWVYYSAALTFLFPMVVWLLGDISVLKIGSGKQVYLYGAYPQFQLILEDIEKAGKGRVIVHQGDSLELSEAEKRHDGRILFILCEAAFRKIPIPIACYFEELFSVNTQIWYVPFKRTADILLSLVFLIVLLLPMLVVALIIFIEDSEHVVFSQIRIGQHGKPFTLYKFRSMRNSEYLEHDPNGNIENRVLKIGHFIRKTRLDETLQFLNVIKGDMSIIGPRPEMQFYHNQAVKEIPCYLYRLDVKPGITGWAQTCFIHTSSMDQYREKTAYDLFYVKKFNPVLDLQILFKTIGTMFLLIGSR